MSQHFNIKSILSETENNFGKISAKTFCYLIHRNEIQECKINYLT